MLSPPCGPGIEVFELHEQHRSLEGVQTEITSHELMLIPGVLTMHAEHSELSSERLVARSHRAAVAEASQVLGGVEREATEVTHGSGSTHFPTRQRWVIGPDGLRSVLDDEQSVSPGDSQDRIHVGTLSVEVHGNDRPKNRLCITVHKHP